MLKLSENNLAKQSKLKKCVAFTMFNLYWVGGHEHMYVTKDLNMDGV